MKKERKKNLRLTRPARRILLVGLPVILAELLYLMLGFLRELQISPSCAVATYPAMFEYIMMSLAILTAGALLTDYIVKMNT